MMKHDNPIEKLRAVVEWFDWQECDMSFGIKTVEDAVKLYDYWVSDESLPEMADVDCDDEGNSVTDIRVKVLGYDPLY